VTTISFFLAAGLMAVPETGAEAGGALVDPVLLIFIALFGLGIALAVALFLTSSIADTWRAAMSNTDRQMLVNALGIGAIFVLLGLMAVFEPFRLSSAAARQQDESAHRGTLHFAQYCVLCHGLTGQGGPVPQEQVVGQSMFAPPVNRPDFRPQDPQEAAERANFIRRVTERGRPGTSMPAWAIEEGGGLNSQEIEDLVTFMQHGNWAEVEEHVSPETLAQIREIQPGIPTDVGEAGPGKVLFGSKGCAGCHMIGGVGGAVAPALDRYGTQPDIADVLPMNEDNLTRWLQNPPAVKPGTLMPNLGLSEEEARQIAEYLLSLR
jgi:mono/diheme cytochrome c family protein